jgi:hypothetical protein
MQFKLNYIPIFVSNKKNEHSFKQYLVVGKIYVKRRELSSYSII